MSLDASDIEEIYKELCIYYNSHSSGIPIEAVSTIEHIINCRFDPEQIEKHIKTEIENIKEQQKKLGNWGDVRLNKSLPDKEALNTILFCPLEDVPLHINGLFMDIARWRLENAK